LASGGRTGAGSGSDLTVVGADRLLIPFSVDWLEAVEYVFGDGRGMGSREEAGIALLAERYDEVFA